MLDTRVGLLQNLLTDSIVLQVDVGDHGVLLQGLKESLERQSKRGDKLQNENALEPGLPTLITDSVALQVEGG